MFAHHLYLFDVLLNGFRSSRSLWLTFSIKGLSFSSWRRSFPNLLQCLSAAITQDSKAQRSGTTLAPDFDCLPDSSGYPCSQVQASSTKAAAHGDSPSLKSCEIAWLRWSIFSSFSLVRCASLSSRLCHRLCSPSLRNFYQLNSIFLSRSAQMEPVVFQFSSCWWWSASYRSIDSATSSASSWFQAQLLVVLSSARSLAQVQSWLVLRALFICLVVSLVSAPYLDTLSCSFVLSVYFIFQLTSYFGAGDLESLEAWIQMCTGPRPY